MKKIDKIQEILDGIKPDADKLIKQRMKSPAGRIRKGLTEISKLCKLCRKEVQEIKAGI